MSNRELISAYKEQLKNLDDEIELRIIAPNAPPYIVEFRIVPLIKEEENE